MVVWRRDVSIFIRLGHCPPFAGILCVMVGSGWTLCYRKGAQVSLAQYLLGMKQWKAGVESGDTVTEINR